MLILKLQTSSDEESPKTRQNGTVLQNVSN